MKLHQLSLFVENQVGHLTGPCTQLAEAGISILTLTLADAQQFGILRLIVSDWRKALEVLEDAEYVVDVTEVLAIEVPDRPGGLNEILKIVDESGLNVEYMYAFTLAAIQRRFSYSGSKM